MNERIKEFEGEIKAQYKEYLKNTYAAYGAFSVKDISATAQFLAGATDAALCLYYLNFKSESKEEWDMKTYLSGNAAGGLFESLGDYNNASKYYEISLASLRRVAVGRDEKTWQKNIDHLTSSIDRIKSK